MGRSLGFVMLIVVVGAGAYLYTKQAKPVGSPASSLIETIGIQNDLMAMANAERRYFVEHAKYASLDELRRNGDTHIPTRPHSFSPIPSTVRNQASGFSNDAK